MEEPKIQIIKEEEGESEEYANVESEDEGHGEDDAEDIDDLVSMTEMSILADNSSSDEHSTDEDIPNIPVTNAPTTRQRATKRPSPRLKRRKTIASKNNMNLKIEIHQKQQQAEQKHSPMTGWFTQATRFFQGKKITKSPDQYGSDSSESPTIRKAEEHLKLKNQIDHLSSKLLVKERTEKDLRDINYLLKEEIANLRNQIDSITRNELNEIDALEGGEVEEEVEVEDESTRMIFVQQDDEYIDSSEEELECDFTPNSPPQIEVEPRAPVKFMGESSPLLKPILSVRAKLFYKNHWRSGRIKLSKTHFEFMMKNRSRMPIQRFPLQLIHSIKLINQVVQILTKDVRLLKFYLKNNNGSDQFIETIKKIIDDKHIVALETPGTDINPLKYVVRSEFKRQGMIFTSRKKNAIHMQADQQWSMSAPSHSNFHTELTKEEMEIEEDEERWRMTSLNSTFSFCETYPKHWMVPKTISNEDLAKIVKHRTKNRIPILCWGNPITNVTLCRSGQPYLGFKKTMGFGKKPMIQDRTESPSSIEDDLEDYYLIQHILHTNPDSEKYIIVDLRNKLAALANKFKGAGFETDYPHCEVHFLNIPNIHTVRSSYVKLQVLCLSYAADHANWNSLVENTKWYELIQGLFVATNFIIHTMHKEKLSVLVHCSDGWDRTAQTVSLVQLLMDSYYRTIKGFCILIEKEFLTTGYMFDTRHGMGEYKPTYTQRSPIFVQFLDAVYQLLKIHPTAFEFNGSFLLDILDASYNGLYTTFLGDSEKARESIPKYNSFWSTIFHRDCYFKYKNGSYLKTKLILKPDLRQGMYSMWNEYWLRHSYLVHPTGIESSQFTY